VWAQMFFVGICLGSNNTKNLAIVVIDSLKVVDIVTEIFFEMVRKDTSGPF
jgi:hypothetical protein